MIQKHQKALIWGFLFGTVGLFLLSALALIFQPVEIVKDWLTIPVRALSQQFAGTDGSNVEVLILTLGNGILYALLFFLVSLIIKRNKN